MLDPRVTLSDCQRALSSIAGRAASGMASEIDIEAMKILMDGMKYLVPALEAALDVNVSTGRFNIDDVVLKLIDTSNDDIVDIEVDDDE
jgi:hypothetical protein